MRKAVLLALVVLSLLTTIRPAGAGLRDIQPRPQQMGYLSDDPVLIPGGMYLVVPSNPNASEVWIRDQAMALIETRTYRRPTVITPNQANGRQSTVWLVTDERYPQIMSALDSSGLPGLGSFTRDEEYQILVADSRVILAANDYSGLRWGLQSLLYLFSEANGTVFVDRVYIRDWPDYSIRVATINNSCRSQEQVDYCHEITDLAYAARMNEIEWNNGDAGQPVFGNPWTIQQAMILRQKFTNLGMKLTMSCDRTAYVVNHPSWQEGVLMNGTPMRVTTTGFTIMPTGLGVSIPNSNLESWSGSRPSSWTMYDDAFWNYIARDQTIRHGGGSSVKWTNLSPATPHSLELRQQLYFGAHHWISIKFWYKVQNFSGELRFKVFGPPPVATGCDFNTYYFTNVTQDWTMIEHRFTTYNIDSVLFMIGPDIATGGNLWIDDITIEAGPMQDLVRRQETTLTVLKRPTNEVMLEGYDYQVVETAGTSYSNYVESPRIDRLATGRLAVNDSVYVNWYCAVPYQHGRQTPCWSLYDNIVDYQQRVRNLDSLLRPDAFKIHINEVSYSGYDPLCLARNMTPGELVGSYCRQLYEAIQARRPGVKVRIYGDPFDIWVRDPRAHPVDELPWNAGGLQQLHPSMEIMGQASYTTDIDSSFSYFQQNGFMSVMAGDGGGWSRVMTGGLAARRWPGTCRGFHFYDYTLELYEQLGDFGDLAWNLGPYFIHSPLNVETSNPTSVVISTQAWSDTFRETTPPSLVNKRVRYRLMPSGGWMETTLLSAGTESYIATVNTTGATGIEYYLTATDHRGQLRSCPADAPVSSFLVMFPSLPPPVVEPGYLQVNFTVTSVGGARLIEWPLVKSAVRYEVRLASAEATSFSETDLVSRQLPEQPRFLIAPEKYPDFDLSRVRVYAIFADRSVPDTK